MPEFAVGGSLRGDGIYIGEVSGIKYPAIFVSSANALRMLGTDPQSIYSFNTETNEFDPIPYEGNTATLAQAIVDVMGLSESLTADSLRKQDTLVPGNIRYKMTPA